MDLLGRTGPEQESHNLWALAQRIIASPARFVFLLEANHAMLHASQLMLTQETAAALRQAGFTDFFSEQDPSEQFFRQKDREKYAENSKQARIVLDDSIPSSRPPESPEYHPVGRYDISAEEVRNAARETLKRNRLLIERFWSMPWAQAFKTPGREPYLFIDVAHVNPQEVAHGITQTRQHVPGYANAVKEAGGLEPFKQCIVQEVITMARLLTHYRIYGEADRASVKKMLDIMKKSKGRAIVNYGAGHGIFTNNPASLPEQLAVQGVTKGISDVTTDTILMVDSEHVPSFCQFIMKVYDAGIMKSPFRESVTVYDVGLQKEWPIRQWFEQVSSIYGANIINPAKLSPS